jgi:hypothetical protein
MASEMGQNRHTKLGEDSTYVQNFSNYGSSFGSSPQNQGSQKSYQSVGLVPSFYGQNQSQGNQFYGQSASSPESFHTANYRGNQQDHDAYLRFDSQSPSLNQFGSGFQGGYTLYSNMNNNQNQQYESTQSPYNYRSNNQQIGGNQAASNQFGNSQSNYTQQQAGGMYGGYDMQGMQGMQFKGFSGGMTAVRSNSGTIPPFRMS